MEPTDTEYSTENSEVEVIMPRTEEQIKRLETARDILKSYNGFRVLDVGGLTMLFNIDTWGYHQPMFITDIAPELRQPETKERTSCGTVGCAWGLLTIHPKMQELGLKTEAIGKQWGYINGEYEPRLAYKFFGLTDDEFGYMFMPSSYIDEIIDDNDSANCDKVTPQMVAAHIDEVLNGKFRKDG